ncbi:MAG TPA: hypothetical protein PKE40_00585 [Arachnia sp.]|nr:hypothetical protein [Arachnia sp.]HMT84822.1 hypothetical protein [Arachnia sp.]
MLDVATSPLSRSDLDSLGMSRADLDSNLQRGTLIRVRRGFYSSNDELEQRSAHRRLMAATWPLVDQGSVFTHESAAVLHGLPLPTVPTSRVFMTRRSPGHGNASPALRVRWTKLDGSEVTMIDGFPVSTLARTVTDLARQLPYEWGVAVCDAALRADLAPSMLEETLRRHPGLRGLPKARNVAKFADARSESPAESISRVQIAQAGLPTPVLQYEIIDANGVVVARTDFGWPEYGLVGEVDGKWKYGELLKPGQTPQDAIMDEKRREERIRQQGLWIVRWDMSTLNRRGELGRLVRRAMQNQQRLHPRPTPH